MSGLLIGTVLSTRHGVSCMHLLGAASSFLYSIEERSQPEQNAAGCTTQARTSRARRECCQRETEEGVYTKIRHNC